VVHWLQEQLSQPADIRLLCSSTQVIPDAKGMDEWGNFPHERQRPLDLVKKTGDVLLLSGNVHFAEISQSKDGSVVEFSSRGMTHVDKLYAKADNTYRIAGLSVKFNLGWVEIEWDNPPKIHLKAISADGNIEFEHTVTLQKKME
jgi:alkaline phosphatase D